ncbi:MAG: adenylate/guanylate cyclase domain-containing protein [Longimicrobiales bacterium]
MKFRRFAVAGAIAAASAAVAFILANATVFQGTFGQVENKTVDYRLRSEARVAQDSQIAMVMFDTASVSEWPYISPFPRAVLADLITAAAQNGATAIGLDVYLGQQYPGLSEKDNGDARLRDAIVKAGNVVIVAPTEGSDRVRHLKRPDPYFADVAAAVASADLPTPMDVLRDNTLAVRTEEGLIPGFALALYAVSKRIDLDSLMRAAAADSTLDLPGLPQRYRRVPATGAMTFPIRFVGPPTKPGEMATGAAIDSATGRAISFGSFRAYPSSVVMGLGAMGTSEFLTSMLGGSIVMMGSSFHESERFRNAYYEERRTDGRQGELAGWLYGVEAHANALQNMLAGKYIRPLDASWAVLLLFAVSLLAAGVTFWQGAKWGALAGMAGVAVSWFGALQAFDASFLIVPMTAPAIAALLAFMSSAAYVSIVEGQEKRMIRGAFSKYVPPGVVDELVADPSKLRLGGEKRTISMLFSDVQGFTSMSEVLAPETLLAVLNEYLNEMSDIVFNEGGTLDKYIGDAVMALYGAPTALPDHAVHACRTALLMQRRLTEMNTAWRAAGKEWGDLHIRIGVNTGSPVVGNIGGDRRFDYTALGDSVNLAARLEPACKNYGVGIMIAEETRRLAGEAIIARELDFLAVYGKAKPVAVYELVALAGEDLGELAELLDLYDKGLAAHRNRDFEMAVQYWKAALEVAPKDGPSLLYLERSEEYMRHPPPADWDFVERRSVK